MKYWVLLGVFVSCNQAMYDKIYRQIIIETIQSNQTAADFKSKNQAIFDLRTLCKGQRSTYETRGK